MALRFFATGSLVLVGAVGSVSLWSVGCSGAKATSGFDVDAGKGDGAGGSATSGATGGTTSGDGPIFTPIDGGDVTPGCSDEAKLIYVLSTDNDLYSFDPPAKKFTRIGALGCSVGKDMKPTTPELAKAWEKTDLYLNGSGSGFPARRGDPGNHRGLNSSRGSLKPGSTCSTWAPSCARRSTAWATTRATCGSTFT